MPLTLGEATRAGELAALIRDAEATIAGIEKRIADRATIASMMVALTSGDIVRADGDMTADESRIVFEFARELLQARLTARRAELNSL